MLEYVTQLIGTQAPAADELTVARDDVEASRWINVVRGGVAAVGARDGTRSRCIDVLVNRFTESRGVRLAVIASHTKVGRVLLDEAFRLSRNETLPYVSSRTPAPLAARRSKVTLCSHPASNPSSSVTASEKSAPSAIRRTARRITSTHSTTISCASSSLFRLVLR